MEVTWERFLETSPIEVISPRFQLATALNQSAVKENPLAKNLGVSPVVTVRELVSVP